MRIKVLRKKDASGEVKQRKSTTNTSNDIPIWERKCLSIEEASRYFNIGQSKLREMVKQEDCEFVLRIGTKSLIKRKQMEEFIDKSYSI